MNMPIFCQGDPDIALVGPYQAGDPDVEAGMVRGLVVMPNKLVVPLLIDGLRPRAAYEMLSGLVAQHGLEVAC